MTRLFEARPFVIAEVGSNWQTFEHCIQSISEAKAAGADAVKFQAFNSDALYGTREVALSHELPLGWLPKLKEKADACGIEFMCTAFSPELVVVVDPYVEVHKVASSDAAWPQMLEAVAKTGKPVLISFGAKSGEERAAAMEILNGECQLGRDLVVPLYCVASYPADYVDIPYFKREHEYEFDGFSDHTLGYTATLEAAHRGAVVIEKHFTAFPDLETPDRPHSLTPEQFRRMMDLIRGKKESRSSEEHAMILRHNRRLIATRDLAEGEVLTYGANYGAYRSLEDDTRGLSPFAWSEVEGKRATKAIARGKGIGPGDFS